MNWKDKYSDAKVIKKIVLQMTDKEFLDWLGEGNERDAYWIEQNLIEMEMYEQCAIVRDYREFIR